MREHGKKLLSMMLALVMVLGMLPAAALAASVPASGSCGAGGDEDDSVTWELDTDGELTISGTGAMADFSPASAPWYGHRGEIESVEIDDGVSSIGSYAFSGCEELEEVEISDSVVWIGNNAFDSCTSLDSITIPGSVTGIGGSAFGYCTDLEEIEVEGGNPAYTSIDGVLFTRDRETLVSCPAGMEGEYTLPAGVTSIGAGAFSGCDDLERITIPDSVTRIGDSAFLDCDSLDSVRYTGSPEQWESISMGAGNSCLTEADLSCDLAGPESPAPPRTAPPPEKRMAAPAAAAVTPATATAAVTAIMTATMAPATVTAIVTAAAPAQTSATSPWTISRRGTTLTPSPPPCPSWRSRPSRARP